MADREPRFYGYRMEFRDEDGHPRRTSGFLGALALAGPGSEVLPHERTLPKAKSDRLALLRATRANLDPVWALSLAPGLTDLLPATVLAECTDDEGVRHQLLDGGDPDLIAAVQESVGRAPVVLADGHHRFETATTFRDEERAEGHRVPGADAIMALVVELADRELTVQPIHRLLHGLPPGFDLRAALAPSFEVHDAGPATPEGVGALRSGMRGPSGGLGLADGGGLALLRPRPDSLERALADVADALRVVDATAFERLVLPALPRVEVTYRNDAATVAALVTKGAADAAVLLRPVTVAQIRDAATAGLRMPQKTTFFAPKPRTGMVFRSLDL
ncbi:MAG: DUF1015 domain-containing protein [Acidimicrobiia bacterium]|nr:DUF1015 domain-containing protein [Acidimicrobiia bacterium]